MGHLTLKPHNEFLLASLLSYPALYNLRLQTNLGIFTALLESTTLLTLSRPCGQHRFTLGTCKQLCQNDHRSRQMHRWI